MLLVHQAGTVKIGEVVRYTLTYTPSHDRILPTPSHLQLKIKNTSAIPLRAAWIHGPYALHVASYPSTFNPHHKVEEPKRYGVPEYEPMLKAGGSWQAKLTVPEEIRETGADLGKQRMSMQSENGGDNDAPQSMTWIVDIASQILFSTSASVDFEILVGRDERSLELGFAAVAGHGHGGPGQIKDMEKHRQKSHGGRHHNQQTAGVYSKAVRLVVEDTHALWDKPALPTWEDEKETYRSKESKRGEEEHLSKQKTRRKKKIHLVVVTHGLHSNVGADMLFLKESIDATTRQARIDAKKRKESYRAKAQEKKQKDAEDESGDIGEQEQEGKDTATAPLSGGQEELDPDEDDEEETIVRGFSGNAARTENGIQYLGKRLAKYILKTTYPDQPFLPIKKPLSRTFTDTFKSKDEKAQRDGMQAHDGSSVHLAKQQQKAEELPYTFSSISFIGHSLGGLIQTYAVAYIHKHSPTFFDQIHPVNFICMASPMLGLSNENPMYVKFALDFGLVGKTGQDLGLTWKPPGIASARGGWNAMIGGLGGSQKDQKQEDPGAKPLLRILPTGPAHQVLRRFRNRTLYSNVVNDGIVPLRTSCLLFLDWRGLGKVDKARRENGLIGTAAEWAWAELTGANSSSVPPNVRAEQANLDTDSDNEFVKRGDGDTVPQPANDETTADNRKLTNRLSFSESDANSNAGSGQQQTQQKGMMDSLFDWFRPSQTKPQPQTIPKKTAKAIRRAQTVRTGEDELPEDAAEGMEGTYSNPTMRPYFGGGAGGGGSKRPAATKGDSFIDNSTGEVVAPPKTSIFESAGDILHPPLPSQQWITDPSSRSRTIFHDRVYHPEDIPPPPAKRPGTRLGRTFSSDNASKLSQSSRESTTSVDTVDSSGMKVEEKIARAYHRDLSWRKVLVRLEPDAHNNMIVRRMFANAYGWPVVKHLCDTHFADTYAARTRDEAEPAKERAPKLDAPINPDVGEEVSDQTAKQPPKRTDSETREAQDELAALDVSQNGSLSSRNRNSARFDSTVWDDSLFEGPDDDDSEIDERGILQKWINPMQPSKPEPSYQRNVSGNSTHAPSTPRTPSAAYTDGHRGLAPISPTSSSKKSARKPGSGSLKSPASTKSTFDAAEVEAPVVTNKLVEEPESMDGPGTTAEVGLRKSVDAQVSPTKRKDGAGGVAESVARASSGQQHP